MGMGCDGMRSEVEQHNNFRFWLPESGRRYLAVTCTVIREGYRSRGKDVLCLGKHGNGNGNGRGKRHLQKNKTICINDEGGDGDGDGDGDGGGDGDGDVFEEEEGDGRRYCSEP
jgi:hypothetical protein